MAIEEHEIEGAGQEAAVAAIDPRFLIRLKNKVYPTFPGVLDAATRAGLKGLTTRIVQVPTPENSHLAVVLVRAAFADGRVFAAVGDAGPVNCSPEIAKSAMRMAETRGAGRAMRAAINCGATLLEELPDGHPPGARQPGAATGNGQTAVRAAQPAAGAAPRPAAGHGSPEETAFCIYADCGVALTKNQLVMSQHKMQMKLCPQHLAVMLEEQKKAQVPG